MNSRLVSVRTTTSSLPPSPRFRRALHGAAVAALLVASPLHAQATRPDTAKGPLVTSVTIRGLKHVDEDELALGIATKGSRCRSLFYAPICLVSKSPVFYERRYLDPLEYRRDALRIRIFLWRKGYRDAVVQESTKKSGNGVRVIFSIKENVPTVVQSLDVRQATPVLPKTAINRAMQIRAGEPLDLVALDSTVSLLRDALWERGYADATVDVDTTGISDALNSGPVAIQIDPGPLTKVAAIDIEGNHNVSSRTIRRLLEFRKGDRFRRSTVLSSQRNLYLSGMFSQVDVHTSDAPQADSQKVVQMKVIESDLNRLEATAGFTTADFFEIDSRYTRYNLIGSARRLTIRGTLANLLAPGLNGSGIFHDVTGGATGANRNRFLRPTWSASVEMNQPWFLSPRNQLGASVFSHRRSVPGVVVDHGVGSSLAFTRELGPRSNSTLGYTYELSSVDASDVYFCVAFGVCDPATIRVVSARNPLSPLGWVTQFDYTNDPFAPNRGYKARFDVEHASRITFSDFRYNRATATASTYLRTSKRTVLSGKLRLGWVNAMRSSSAALGLQSLDQRIIHPRARFYAGGSKSVRGYAENQLGPRVLTVDPRVLTDTALGTPCTTSSLASGTCDPNIAGLNSSAFLPQPVGGTSVVEGSVEFHFPLAIANGLVGAVFLDGATVGAHQLAAPLNSKTAVTPGFGVRLDTPVGPVRLDLGIKPRVVENLPVVTQVSDSTGALRLVTLKTLRRYNPLDASGSGFRRLLNRLELHLAIGPAF